MTIRRTFQGAIEITADDSWGISVTRQYFFYTLKEAKQMFRAEMKKRNAS
jgi:hypothetical protein